MCQTFRPLRAIIPTTVHGCLIQTYKVFKNLIGFDLRKTYSSMAINTPYGPETISPFRRPAAFRYGGVGAFTGRNALARTDYRRHYALDCGLVDHRAD